MSSDPIEEFDSLVQNHDFVFAVVYRGTFCPFCKAYIKSLASLASSITAAKGTPVIITSQPASFLPVMREATGYEGPAIVDTEHRLVSQWCRKKYVDVAITPREGYEHDMAQPAILVLKRDGTVVESWASVPTEDNYHGAKNRPMLPEVWEYVEAELAGKKPVKKDYTLMTSF